MGKTEKEFHGWGARLRARVWQALLAAVRETAADELMVAEAGMERLVAGVVQRLEEEALHYACADPAAHGDPRLVVEAYSSFLCVLHYRLAHAILNGETHASARKRAARWLADQGKVISGVDIHPAAKIGRRLILDHAVGTVIGETCEIGDDCYLLGGVVLGARGIAHNARGPRHPRIGHRVQIGAFARILGPVSVGDDVFVSPHCVVTADVPAQALVSIANQIQVCRTPAGRACGLQVAGSCLAEGALLVFGSGFRQPQAEVIDAEHAVCGFVQAQVRRIDRHVLRVVLRESGPGWVPDVRLHLRLRDGDDEVVILDPPGLAQCLSRPEQPECVA